MKPVIGWLPAGVDARVRFLAILTLFSQIAIIGTGGAVRLTGSGLGCPSWPQCTADSLIPTPELGIHGIIEFANRTMAGVLALIALAMFLSVSRFAAARRDLFVLSLLIGIGVITQAVIGGVTVLLDLDPSIVGLHFIISIVLVALGTVLAWRVWFGRSAARVVPGRLRGVAYTTSLFAAITIVVGIITTGSGPHAGDGGAARNGLDPEILQHFHAWPAYATFAGTLLLAAGALRLRDARFMRFVLLLLGIELVQIAVGLFQSNTGLPPLLVGIHMVLAGCLASAMTAVILALKR